MSRSALRHMREITDKEVIHVRSMQSAGRLLARRMGAELWEMLTRENPCTAAGQEASTCASSCFSARQYAVAAFQEALARLPGLRLRGHEFSCGARSVAMVPLSDGRAIVEAHDMAHDEQTAWLARDKQEGVEHFIDLVRWAVSTSDEERCDD